MQDVAPVSVVPRKRRGVELALIIFALGLALGAYALVDLNVTGELSPTFPYVAGICVLLAALAHLAVRWRLPYADPVILPCVILLNGLGLVMIHRIDLINDPPLNGARQQLIWTALGVLIFILIVTWLNDHRPLQGFTYTIGIAGIVLLLLPLVPGLGTEKFGAQIWIQVGPYSFQPAEAAKVLLAIAFASYLVEKRDVLALAGAGRHVQARAMAEMAVPYEPDLLERLEVAVHRREVRARQAAGKAVGDLLGRDRGMGGVQGLEHQTSGRGDP